MMSFDCCIVRSMRLRVRLLIRRLVLDRLILFVLPILFAIAVLSLRAFIEHSLIQLSNGYQPVSSALFLSNCLINLDRSAITT
jgi:hypothetical protein